MDCNEIKEKLSAYIEKQLPHDEQMKMNAHLKTCKRCSLALSDLEKAIEYMRGIEEIEPPAWLQKKVMVKIREEGERKKGIWQKLFYPLHVKVPLEVFATIAIAVTVFYVLKTVQPVMKEAEAPSGQDIVSMQEEENKPPAKDKRIVPPSAKGGEGGFPSAPREVQKSIENQIQKEVPAAKTEIAGEHIDSGKEERIIEKRYKVLDMRERKEERAFAPGPAGLHELMQTLSITVYAEDILLARNKVEKAIKDLGGEVLKIETFEDKEIITAKLDSPKVEGLNKKLRSIGEIKGEKATLENLKGALEIKIEIARK